MAILAPIATSGITEVRTSLTCGIDHINTVNLGADPDGGTVTAGTLTVRAKSVSGAEFEAITPNTIDLAAPIHLQLCGKIEEYEFTVTGFAGTATKVYIALDATA